MTIQASEILQQLAPKEHTDVARIDSDLERLVNSKVARSYTYNHAKYNSHYSTQVLKEIQRRWRDAGWSVKFDAWYIYLDLHEPY